MLFIVRMLIEMGWERNRGTNREREREREREQKKMCKQK